MLAPLNESVLPQGIRSRLVAGINGLEVHVLEAGFETPHRPLVLLIHGFPNLHLAGASCCCPWPKRDSRWWHRISAGMGVRQVGSRTSMTMSPPSDC